MITLLALFGIAEGVIIWRFLAGIGAGQQHERRVRLGHLGTRQRGGLHRDRRRRLLRRPALLPPQPRPVPPAGAAVGAGGRHRLLAGRRLHHRGPGPALEHVLAGDAAHVEPVLGPAGGGGLRDCLRVRALDRDAPGGAGPGRHEPPPALVGLGPALGRAAGPRHALRHRAGHAPAHDAPELAGRADDRGRPQAPPALAHDAAAAAGAGLLPVHGPGHGGGPHAP